MGYNKRYGLKFNKKLFTPFICEAESISLKDHEMFKDAKQ